MCASESADEVRRVDAECTAEIWRGMHRRNWLHKSKECEAVTASCILNQFWQWLIAEARKIRYGSCCKKVLHDVLKIYLNQDRTLRYGPHANGYWIRRSPACCAVFDTAQLASHRCKISSRTFVGEDRSGACKANEARDPSRPCRLTPREPATGKLRRQGVCIHMCVGRRESRGDH